MKNIDDILKENKAKPEPYKVPDGYFEDFTARLNAKIDEMEAEKAASGQKPVELTRGQRLWITLKPLVYVAAAIMILYGATYIIVQPKVNRAVIETTARIDRNQVNKAIQEYEDYYQYVIDEDDIDGEDFMEYCYLE